MRTKSIIFLMVAAFLTAMPMQAQFGRITGAINQANKKNEVEKEQKAQADKAAADAVKGNGIVYYVSATGSARADGKSAATPKKDIQAVLNIIRDNGENGAVVRVAEGNYLGYMNSGYIEIYNFITLEGGWNSDFTQRDPLKYITKMEPTQDQLGSNGSKGVIHTNRALDEVTAKKPKGTLIIDGIFINLGFENHYMPADPSDPRFGCPSKAFETGRMVDAIPPHRSSIPTAGSQVTSSSVTASSLTVFISLSNSVRVAVKWRYATISSSPTGTVRAVSTAVTRTAKHPTSISIITRLPSLGVATKRWAIWDTDMSV